MRNAVLAHHDVCFTTLFGGTGLSRSRLEITQQAIAEKKLGSNFDHRSAIPGHATNKQFPAKQPRLS
ncbi:hypothetical protein ACWF50_11615 [Brucella pseudogrignonensis]|jgi:hypothetical protein